MAEKLIDDILRIMKLQNPKEVIARPIYMPDIML